MVGNKRRGESVQVDRNRGFQDKRSRSCQIGEAICDMKGDLWELDAAFLGAMKQLVPGWSGGVLSSEVMSELKNTGKLQANGFLLIAQLMSSDRISLRISPFDD